MNLAVVGMAEAVLNGRVYLVEFSECLDQEIIILLFSFLFCSLSICNGIIVNPYTAYVLWLSKETHKSWLSYLYMKCYQVLEFELVYWVILSSL